MRISFRRIGAAILNDWGLKLLALALAVLAFFVIQGKTGIEIPYEIPLEVKFEEPGIAILEQEIRVVRVTFRGSQEDLRRLDQQTLKAVVWLKVGLAVGSEDVRILPGNIEGVGTGVRVVAIQPESVSLTFDREAKVMMAVAKPRTIGTPLSGQVELEYEPQTVTIRGPMRRLQGQTTLAVEPVDVDGRVASFSKKVKVLPPSDAWVSEIEPPTILVRVNIVTESVIRHWTNVAVMAMAPVGMESRLRLEPSGVNLSLEGGAEDVEGLADENIMVFVNLCGVEPSGAYELPVQVHLPAGIDVSAIIDPETIKAAFDQR